MDSLENDSQLELRMAKTIRNSSCEWPKRFATRVANCQSDSQLELRFPLVRYETLRNLMKPYENLRNH